ncbi:MAG TPA: transglycosylase domain-containing protein, partial [Candidatus Woesebacteria bacterium]|nr:transglycosylase domain-containing protein [Candidatus Woesebacteria bacterium]
MSKTRKKTKKGRRRWLAIVLIALMVIGIGIIIFTLFNVPSPKKLSSGEYAQSSQIFDRNGELLYEIYAEKRRLPVKLDEVPENLKKATLAIEDANFYKHGGFDIKGLARGLYRTIIEKRLQGGSTLTQQLVKNGLLTPERTLSRKFKEAVLTVATEVMYSKDEILEMYFNQTPYGGTLWGVQSAANGIFNKEVKDLTLAESALLAGLPASPTKYSPFSYPETAKARQMLVLERMKELKMISQDEYDKAKEEHLNYYVNKAQIKAPHFVFWVKNLLMQKYGIKKVTEGGLKITTTLDME